MPRKPWPILILSLIFFILPLLNLIGTYILLPFDISFIEYLHQLQINSVNHLKLFNMVMPSIVAGVAIYSVKRWSYPVFLTSMVWLFTQSLTDYGQETPLLTRLISLGLPMIFNILVVSYVLLPNVRAAYFNPRLRWWESKPRYRFEANISIKRDSKEVLGKISNISEGGVFISTEGPIGVDQLINISFKIFGRHFDVIGKTLYQKGSDYSYGIEFQRLTSNDLKNIRAVIKEMAQARYPETRPVPVWTEDLTAWFKKLVKTGKGFVPELPTDKRK